MEGSPVRKEDFRATDHRAETVAGQEGESDLRRPRVALPVEPDLAVGKADVGRGVIRTKDVRCRGRAGEGHEQRRNQER
jgi:hypothetical protein